jgi:polysaccharide biosynthesis transport protein
MDQDLVRLQDHLAVIRRRWRLVAICLLLAVAASLALSLTQTKMYQGTTSLLLQPQQSADSDTSIVMEPEEVATQADVIASVQVAERVVDDLELDVDDPQDLLDDITVTVVEDKRVVQVSALEPRARLASAVANSFAEQYIAYRQEQAIDASADLQDEYADQLQVIEEDLDEVQDKMDSASGNRLDRLRSDETRLLSEQIRIQTALSSAQTSQAGLLPGGEVLLRAEPPGAPAEPQPIRAGLLGGVIGLLLGIGLAYVRDRLDDAIRDEQRLRAALGGRPILASIPSSGDESSGRVSTLTAPQAPLSEAYRTLNTNVRFLLAAGRDHQEEGRGNILLVTSAAPGEGKTSVATNLAVAASRVGMRVIVVDADLRRPAVADRFGLDVPVGLSDLLANGEPAFPHVHEVGLDDLSVLAAGSTPPNPAELLASPLMAGLLDDLARHADLVIVDSAPILRVADSLELINQVDLLLLVARRKVSRMRTVSAAADRIRQVGGNLSGCVFNDVVARDSSYGYGYPSRPPEKPSKRRQKKMAKERERVKEAAAMEENQKVRTSTGRPSSSD